MSLAEDIVSRSHDQLVKKAVERLGVSLVAEMLGVDGAYVLSLDDEINQALLRHEGPLGRILACTLAYERCDWESLDTLGLDPSQINDAYLTALAEAYRVTYELLKG